MIVRGLVADWKGEPSKQIGAVLPQGEIGTDFASIRDYVQAMQDLGYDHVVTSDHVLGADPAGHPGWSRPQIHTSVVHEPFVLFGYIAGVAPNLGLLTNVVIMPQRQTALVAKQAAEVDIVADGRFRLGLGIGWNAVEFEGLNESFKNRGRRFEEQVDLLRKLWTEPSLSYQGQYHTVTAAGISPLPVQRPIPIWVGATAEAAVKRATRIADGYLPLAPIDGKGTFAETMERVHGWLRDAGRDPASFGVEPRLNASTGTPDDWRKVVEEWRGLGATHIHVATNGGGLSGAAAHIQRLREARAVLAP